MLLIEFFSPNCTYCKLMNPLLDDLERQYKNKIRVKRINTKDSPDLSKLFNIKSVPTLILMENGSEIKRSTGYKNILDLRSFILTT